MAEDHGGGRSEPAGGAEAGNNRASDENGASSLGRISCVFFVTPDPDTVVSLESRKDAPKYSNWRKARVKRAMNALRGSHFP